MRSALVGIAAAIAVTLVAGGAAAAPAKDPRLSITRGDGSVTISVNAETLTVTEQLTASGFTLTLADGRDVARISGDLQGKVSVERGGRTLALDMTVAGPDEAASVRALLAGSVALERFERLMASEWAQTKQEAVVLLSAHAMVALLQGDAVPLQAFVQRVGSAAAPRLTTVAQPYTAAQCWNIYERDVIEYTYELQRCLEAASDGWNPINTAFCAYSYNLKATLAFMWLLDCSGVPF